MKTNCYHRRNTKDQKVVGGMTHCKSYEEAAAVACHGLTVQTTPTGRLYFADATGREVRVYLSVHPEHTPDGKVLQDQIDQEREARIEDMRRRAFDRGLAL